MFFFCLFLKWFFVWSKGLVMLLLVLFFLFELFLLLLLRELWVDGKEFIWLRDLFDLCFCLIECIFKGLSFLLNMGLLKLCVFVVFGLFWFLLSGYFWNFFFWLEVCFFFLIFGNILFLFVYLFLVLKEKLLRLYFSISKFSILLLLILWVLKLFVKFM